MNTKEKELKFSKEETILAEKRTVLAATRTLLSHIRTAIVIISLAFAFMKLDKAHPIDAFTIILFVLSGIVLVVGIVDFIVSKNYAQKIIEQRKKDA